MKKILGNVAMVIIAVGLSVLINKFMINKQKTGWVSLPEVFSKFEYKKELEKKYTKSEEARKKIIDSLELDLKISYKKIQSSEKITDDMKAKFQLQQESYVEKKSSLEKDNNKMKTEFNNQILNQLNQYVQEFGKEKGYMIIIGGDGNGSLMYGNEDDNVSNEVIDYINTKYKGQVN